jgi:uncharacterized protein (TIGR03083 family)
MDGPSERCATLAEVWQWWATSLSGLEPAAWNRPSRLPGWDVAALVAHASLLVGGLKRFVSRPVEVAPNIASARDLLARFNEPDGVATTAADTVAEGARQRAARLTPADLLAIYTVHAPAVIAAVEAAGPIVVDYFGVTTLPLDAAVSVATMEAVAHGLDLCASCGIPPASIPTRALDHTVQLLASMAPAIDFVEAATGRAAADIVLPVLR